jgi:superfamily II DNA or RNA helicase
MAAMLRGEIKVLANVGTMTEGVDIPIASTVIMTRACDHHSIYLQMVGRVLRACDGKTESKLLDLTGTSYKHGAPSQNRTYSLTGNEPIMLSLDRDGSGHGRTPYEVIDAEIIDAGTHAAAMRSRA